MSLIGMPLARYVRHGFDIAACGKIRPSLRASWVKELDKDAAAFRFEHKRSES